MARGLTICPSPQQVSVSIQKVLVQQMELLGLEKRVSELAVGVQYSSILVLLQFLTIWSIGSPLTVCVRTTTHASTGIQSEIAISIALDRA